MQIPAKRKKIPQKRSPASWMPPGQEVTVGPYRIPDGMVYVGERLAAVSRWLGTEPALIRQLKRIYRLLGFDPGMLYSDIHAVAAGSFVVEKGTSRSGLDLQRIEDKLAETVQASALLGEIFGEEEGDEALEIDPGVLRQMLGLEGAES